MSLNANRLPPGTGWRYWIRARTLAVVADVSPADESGARTKDVAATTMFPLPMPAGIGSHSASGTCGNAGTAAADSEQTSARLTALRPARRRFGVVPASPRPAR